jgi:hypothetical protein
MKTGENVTLEEYQIEFRCADGCMVQHYIKDLSSLEEAEKKVADKEAQPGGFSDLRYVAIRKTTTTTKFVPEEGIDDVIITDSLVRLVRDTEGNFGRDTEGDVNLRQKYSDLTALQSSLGNA